MKIKNIFSAILMAMLVMTAPLTLTSCDGEDQLDTNQFSESLSLLSFGPSPVARGGELRFIGTGLNNVKSISLEGCEDITDITRKSNREISIIVPKNAQPGYVVLHAAKKDLVSKTQLTFTEPVGFAETAALSPNTIKPGQTLTIKGTYLNLVESVIFAEGVAVDKFETSSATEPMNMTIKVVVPEEAQTGKLFLGFVATGDTMMNRVLSNEILTVTLPSVKEIANLSGKKPGDKIELEGADLDLVTNVTVANEEVEFEVADDKLSFVLPASTPDAAEIAMYPASGIKVTIATIGMTVPSELVATPATELRIGSEVVISGNDLDVVETVTFPGLTTATVFTFAEGKIKVNCPEGFTSGDVVLTCKSGIEVKVAIATQKPVFESFAAAAVSMGNDVTINGQNLDLVVKVIYPGDREGEINAGGSATQIVVTMPPSGVESGKITMVMANGETAETGELTVNEPEFAYAADPSAFITTEENEIKAGSLITTGIKNGGHLSKVEIDGNECQHMLQGETIYILTSENAGFSSKIKFISDNGEIEYDLSVVPNSSKKVAIWKGMTELTWNDGGRVFIPGTAFNDVPEGAILHLCYTQKDGTWGQAQINNGWWQKILDWPSDDECEGKTNGEGALVPTDVYGWFSDGVLNRDTKFRLTADMLEHLRSHVGDDGSAIVIQGADLIFTEVYITWEVSLETTIWTGSFNLGSWNSNFEFGKGTDENKMAFIEYGVKAGTILRVYITPSADDWCVKFNDGHWGALALPGYEGNPDPAAVSLGAYEGVNGVGSFKGVIEVTLGAEQAAKLTDQTLYDWGMSVVFNGTNATITKITLE